MLNVKYRFNGTEIVVNNASPGCREQEVAKNAFAGAVKNSPPRNDQDLLFAELPVEKDSGAVRLTRNTLDGSSDGWLVEFYNGPFGQCFCEFDDVDTAIAFWESEVSRCFDKTNS